MSWDQKSISIPQAHRRKNQKSVSIVGQHWVTENSTLAIDADSVTGQSVGHAHRAAYNWKLEASFGAHVRHA